MDRIHERLTRLATRPVRVAYRRWLEVQVERSRLLGAVMTDAMAERLEREIDADAEALERLREDGREAGAS